MPIDKKKFTICRDRKKWLANLKTWFIGLRIFYSDGNSNYKSVRYKPITTIELVIDNLSDLTYIKHLEII